MANRRRRKCRVEECLVTTSIREAFEAAMALGLEWASPDGPAVVREVKQYGTGWIVHYRVVRHWGKEAWA